MFVHLFLKMALFSNFVGFEHKKLTE